MAEFAVVALVLIILIVLLVLALVVFVVAVAIQWAVIAIFVLDPVVVGYKVVYLKGLFLSFGTLVLMTLVTLLSEVLFAAT